MYKKVILFSLAVFSFAVFSCKDDNDTTKPGVTVTSPSSGEKYATGETIHLSADFSDNKELKSSSVSLSYSGSDASPWKPGAVNISLSGTSQLVSQDVFGSIPGNIALGDYTMTVEVSDAAGNTESRSVDIEIVSNAPGLEVTSPQEDQSYVAGQDFMTLTAVCADNNGLRILVCSVEFMDSGKASLKGATGVNDPWEPMEQTFQLSGTSHSFNDEPLFGGQIPECLSGNYKLTLKLYDVDDNVTTTEINFTLTN